MFKIVLLLFVILTNKLLMLHVKDTNLDPLISQIYKFDTLLDPAVSTPVCNDRLRLKNKTFSDDDYGSQRQN